MIFTYILKIGFKNGLWNVPARFPEAFPAAFLAEFPAEFPAEFSTAFPTEFPVAFPAEFPAVSVVFIKSRSNIRHVLKSSEPKWVNHASCFQQPFEYSKQPKIKFCGT